eukprot:m.102352 g.102352  ORF g.102352 m.102352 type:complete len:140 (-) comp13769_c0_seq6:786-1205(-)
MLIINGDIGGTNGRLELYEGGSEMAATDFTLKFASTLPSSNFKGLADLVSTFLQNATKEGKYNDGDIIDGCCLAVCGPVKDEAFMCGPVLPAQPPTQWKAHKDDLVKGPLGKIIKRVCFTAYCSFRYILIVLAPGLSHQ